MFGNIKFLKKTMLTVRDGHVLTEGEENRSSPYSCLFFLLASANWNPVATALPTAISDHSVISRESENVTVSLCSAVRTLSSRALDTVALSACSGLGFPSSSKGALLRLGSPFSIPLTADGEKVQSTSLSLDSRCSTLVFVKCHDTLVGGLGNITLASR